MVGDPEPLHDEMLTRYLLGQLPTEQAEALDERSVVDPPFAERLRGIELDLADAYVRGELSPAERQHWERTFAASRAGQEHLRLAEALAMAEPRRNRAAPVSPAIRSSPWTSRRIRSLAAAAALALTLSAAYAIRRGEPEPGGLSTAGTIGVQPSPPAAVPTAPPPSPAVIALTLAAPTRSQAEAPVLTIPTGAPEVQLRLRLDPAPFSRYAIDVRDLASGRVIWRATDVAAIESTDGRVLPVTVPASAFHDGRFALDVHGKSARGTEIVGTYPLKVTVGNR